MNKPASPSGSDPYEPLGSDLSVRNSTSQRRPLKWYHLLAFFSPAVVCLLSIRFGPSVGVFLGLTPDSSGRGLAEFFKSAEWGMGLGALLCLVIGDWFSRSDDIPPRRSFGCFWTLCCLIVNGSLAWGGCFLMVM